MKNTPEIRVLPVHVANKIAAGEVVDRPASVLKELLENAIDAGAVQLDVEITSGGRKLVAVSDNGSGMDRDNALLSLERQATSKIRDVDDIEKIATLGFRGEALAAIASVSRFRMVTCRGDGTAGTEILVTGGKIRDVRETGAPAGTTIEVRDLFFNVPARRKFLRSYQTEASHIRNCFNVQALACPDTGMTLVIDGRKALTLPAGGTLEDRMTDLFGPDYMKSLKRVDHEHNGIKIYGYAGVPSVSRSDRSEQYIFINSRAAAAPVLGYAIKEGYRTIMPDKRFPVIFLFLELEPDLVDVNVHPTKKEVRFRRPNDVRDAVITALKNTLAMTAETPITGIAKDVSEFIPPKAQPGEQLAIEGLPSVPEFKYSGRPFSEGATTRPEDRSDSAPEPQISNIESPASSPWAWCRVLGQVGGLYVLLETEDGYVIMDPHAAHERVLFEKYMNDVLENSVQVQDLLMPETLDFQSKDAMLVRKNLALLKQMGFGISEFGGDTFVVDALPAYFNDTSAASVITEIAVTLERAGKRGGTERWREETVAQAACKAAVKARDKLNLKEIEQLVADLAGCEMPYTCPHGRPTLIFTSYRDLNRKFGRE